MSKPQRDGVTPRKRWWLWSALLAVALWLALFGDKSPVVDAALSLPAARPATPARTQEVPPVDTKELPANVLLSLVAREELFGASAGAAAKEHTPVNDLFARRNWNPPPAPVLAEPPQAPIAPPVPYAFLGKKLEGETWEVFLARGEQTFIVRAGEVLEAEWRVDRIAPPALALTYLPLGQLQTISIGEVR